MISDISKFSEYKAYGEPHLCARNGWEYYSQLVNMDKAPYLVTVQRLPSRQDELGNVTLGNIETVDIYPPVPEQVEKKLVEAMINGV